MDGKADQKAGVNDNRTGIQAGGEYSGVQRAWGKILSSFGASSDREGSGSGEVDNSLSQIVRRTDQIRNEILERVREKERAHEELDLQISKVCEHGYQDISPKFAFGDVDVIKVHPKIPIKIAEGWHSTMVYKDGDLDRYSVNFKTGSVLDWHSHLQVEMITVVSGTLKLYYVSKVYPVDSEDMKEHMIKVILKRGDQFIIKSQLMHRLVAEEGGSCYVSFEPPLSAEDNPLPDVGDE